MPDTILSILTEEERAIWDCVETANGAGALAQVSRVRGDLVRAKLLAVMALLNGGDGGQAKALLDEMPDEMDGVSQLWHRAEFQLVARRESSIVLSDAQILSADDVAQAGAGTGPLERLVAARVHLAFGLSRLHDSDYPAAEAQFRKAVAAMREIGCESGLATALTELGKVHAWRGELQAAHAYYLEALSIWQSLNNGEADAVWHEIGASLLDSGRADVAVGILERTYKRNGSERTQHAWVRALIACERWLEAEKEAAAALVQVQADAQALMSDGATGHDRYREFMLMRELGVIAASQHLIAAEREGDGQNARSVALRHLGAAIEACGGPEDPKAPIFTQWIGSMDSDTRRSAAGLEEDTGSGSSFNQIRLVQLELLIQSFNAPAEAAIGFEKVAEVFSRRTEPVLEIEARQQAADAYLRAEAVTLATRQLHLAVRLAVERGLVEKAAMLRRRLLKVVKAGPLGVFATEGYLPTKLIRSSDGYAIAGGVDVNDGRQTMIHQIELGEDVNRVLLDERLAALSALSGAGRGHPGLPRLLRRVLSDAQGDAGQLTLVTEHIDGQKLGEVMRQDAENVSRAVRIVRDLSEAVQLLHNAGIKQCRPVAQHVLIELGDNPVFLDMSPLHVADGKPGKTDTRYLADILIDWITAGRGVPMRRLTDILRGRVPYNSLLHAATKDEINDGLVQLMNDVLADNGTDDLSPGAFAAQLQAFT